MALHDDLLAQASRLARAEPKKPKQASLRRAISAAYYALFHILTDASSRFLATGTRDALRRQLARSFEHGHMKNAARAFATNSRDNAWVALLDRPPSAHLVDVASSFVELQETRHQADYDLTRAFTRIESEALIAKARTAIGRWSSVAGTEEGDAFLVALVLRVRS